jgi:hypothetical protein
VFKAEADFASDCIQVASALTPSIVRDIPPFAPGYMPITPRCDLHDVVGPWVKWSAMANNLQVKYAALRFH